jgi:hypothetical protein
MSPKVWLFALFIISTTINGEIIEKILTAPTPEYFNYMFPQDRDCVGLFNQSWLSIIPSQSNISMYVTPFIKDVRIITGIDFELVRFREFTGKQLYKLIVDELFIQTNESIIIPLKTFMPEKPTRRLYMRIMMSFILNNVPSRSTYNLHLSLNCMKKTKKEFPNITVNVYDDFYRIYDHTNTTGIISEADGELIHLYENPQNVRIQCVSGALKPTTYPCKFLITKPCVNSVVIYDRWN